jgi:outer membrane protein OmpA-like peptidoglycan-associated protein
MVPVGYGETKLVNDCSDDVDCSEEEHQQNRRTTVRVLKTDYKIKR